MKTFFLKRIKVPKQALIESTGFNQSCSISQTATPPQGGGGVGKAEPSQECQGPLSSTPACIPQRTIFRDTTDGQSQLEEEEWGGGRSYYKGFCGQPCPEHRWCWNGDFRKKVKQTRRAMTRAAWVDWCVCLTRINLWLSNSQIEELLHVTSVNNNLLVFKYYCEWVFMDIFDEPLKKRRKGWCVCMSEGKNRSLGLARLWMKSPENKTSGTNGWLKKGRRAIHAVESFSTVTWTQCEETLLRLAKM